MHIFVVEQTTLSSRVAHHLHSIDASIFAPLPLELLPCYLSTDLTMGSRYGVGLDDSSRSPLPFTCTAPTHDFNFSMPFLDLSVREFCQKSSVLATLLWLLCVLCALILLAAMLWLPYGREMSTLFANLVYLTFATHFC